MHTWVQRNYTLLFALAGVAVVLVLPSLLPGHHNNHWGRRAVIALVIGTLNSVLAWLVQRREQAERAYHQDLMRNYLQKICLIAPDARDLVTEAKIVLDRLEYGEAGRAPQRKAKSGRNPRYEVTNAQSYERA